jgi:NAD(P)-dependent dehydrogenase (short-subunit alcohol dehydrogenase family)
MADQTVRTALVTGASSGIGFGIAELLARKGYRVVLTARNPERLRDAADRIGARWFAVDAADEAGMTAVCDEIGTVDLLVHSAGVFAAKAMRKQSAEEFQDIVTANLTGAYVACRTAVAHMQPGGRVILIASTSGLDGHRWLTAYAASKAGVRLMARSMRAEVERDGISVTVLNLATVDTPMMEDIARPAIFVEDVASAVVWLDSLHPRVRISELNLRSADDSPFGYRITPKDAQRLHNGADRADDVFDAPNIPRQG